MQSDDITAQTKAKLEQILSDYKEPPVIDIQAYFEKREGVWEQECLKVAASLHKFGVLIVKDPRVNH